MAHPRKTCVPQLLLNGVRFLAVCCVLLPVLHDSTHTYTALAHSLATPVNNIYDLKPQLFESLEDPENRVFISSAPFVDAHGNTLPLQLEPTVMSGYHESTAVNVVRRSERAPSAHIMSPRQVVSAGGVLNGADQGSGTDPVITTDKDQIADGSTQLEPSIGEGVMPLDDVASMSNVEQVRTCMYSTFPT